MLGEPQRELLDGDRLPLLSSSSISLTGSDAIARFQHALVEGDLDRAGRQVDDALMPVDVAGEDRLDRVTFEIGAKLCRE